MIRIQELPFKSIKILTQNLIVPNKMNSFQNTDLGVNVKVIDFKIFS